MVGAIVTVCFVIPKASRSSQDAPKPTVRIVQQPEEVKPIVRMIPLSGEFVADPASLVVVGDTSTRIKKALVKVGQSVEKGQPLAIVSLGAVPRFEAPRFDARSESSHARQLSDALGSALNDHEKALEAAKRALEVAQSEHGAAIKRAQEEFDSARQAPPAQLAAARNAYEDARAARDKAKTLADRDAKALEEGWVSRNQATASRNAYDSAESAFRAVEEKLQQLDKGVSESEVRAAKDKLAKAKTEADVKLKEATENLERVQSGGLAFGNSSRIAMPTFRFPTPGAVKGRIGKPVELKSPFKGTVLRADEHGFQLLVDGGKCEFVALVSGEHVHELRQGMVVRLPNDNRGVLSGIGNRDPKTGLSVVTVSCPVLSLPGKAQATIALSR